jgi:hypothetical protein
VAKAFAANDDVAFGDVNLSEERIVGNHNPGAGGWPTIRYFNKKTGIAGGTYVKKTDQHMCMELGSLETMTDYVEEYALTSLCSVSNGNGCDEKELVFIEEVKGMSDAEKAAQFARLSEMDPSAMAPELSYWLSKRMKMLKQFVDAEDEDEL